MNGLFAVDGKLYQVMGKLADLVLLNLLWVLCSIPVITAGASTAAFYSVLLKMARNEEAYIFRSFFHAFHENLRQASAVFGILLAACGLLGCDLYVCARMGGRAGKGLFTVFCVVAVFVYMTACYLFPVIAFFQNSTKKVFKNSFLLAIAYFPYTILIAAVSLCPWLLLFFGEFVYAAFFDVVIGFSLAGLLNAHLLRRIFSRCSCGQAPQPQQEHTVTPQGMGMRQEHTLSLQEKQRQRPEKLRTLLEKQRFQWETIRTLHGKKRLEHLWTYYKFVLVLLLAAVLVLCTAGVMIRNSLNHTVLSVVIVDAARTDGAAARELEEELLDLLGFHGKHDHIEVVLSATSKNTEENIAKLRVALSSVSGADVVICGEDVYEEYSRQDAFAEIEVPSEDGHAAGGDHAAVKKLDLAEHRNSVFSEYIGYSPACLSVMEHSARKENAWALIRYMSRCDL